MIKKFLNQADVNRMAAAVSQSILRSKQPHLEANLYGVPRGGIPAAYLVSSFSHQLKVVDDIVQADFIIDDLIDSGGTKARYEKEYPNKPFITLFKKEDEEQWIVFPWEQSEEGSAADIPTRLLQYIGEDVHRGGLRETPKRFLNAWKHFTAGYSQRPSDILKTFEDGAEHYNEIVLVRDIPIYSQCEHHLIPFFGVAHIGYIPDNKIVGLSKLNRIADMFARRLQVQERLTNQIADCLEDNLDPLGVAVILKCRHLCMEARGVCQQGHTTVTSAMRGAFMGDGRARAEFLELIK